MLFLKIFGFTDDGFTDSRITDFWIEEFRDSFQTSDG